MFDKDYIIRNSTNDLYKFNINKGNLIVEKYNNNKIAYNFVLLKNVSYYSLDIDDYDKIHVVYLDTQNKLEYLSYDRDFNILTKNIIRQECAIKTLYIKIINKTIHIFFNHEDLLKNINYITHSYYIDNWIYNDIAQYECVKYVHAYFVDYYMDKIYLLYCKDNITGEYLIKKLSIDNSKDVDLQDSVILKDIYNLNFFITANGMGIIYYNKCINNNIQTIIRHKNLNISNSNWSDEINISPSNVNTLKSILFTHLNNFYFLCEQGNDIVLYKSIDLYNWAIEFTVPSKSRETHKIFYKSNYNEDKNLRLQALYLSYLQPIDTVVNLDLDNCFHYLGLDNINEYLSNVEEIQDNNFVSLPINNQSPTDKSKDTLLKALAYKIRIKSKGKSTLNEDTLKLKNEIKSLNDSINNYENELKNAKLENIATMESYTKQLHYYESEIRGLKEENERLFLDMYKKIKTLFNIIEQKDKLIQNLYSIIKSKNFRAY